MKRRIRQYKGPICLLALVAIGVFLYFYYGGNAVTIAIDEHVVAIATNVATMIAAIGFWIELKGNKDASEANFIMSLNDQFISNDQLTSVEHALMQSFAQWSDGQGELILELDLTLSRKDRQALINYLVYLEGLAAIVRCNSLRSDMIADLFAYRFFIAVNNPIVQQIELLPYANYYSGCYELSKVWTKKWQREGREIPFVKEADKAENQTQTQELKFQASNDYTLSQKGYIPLKDKLKYNGELNRPAFPKESELN